jgi:hypothetical protein
MRILYDSQGRSASWESLKNCAAALDRRRFIQAAAYKVPDY